MDLKPGRSYVLLGWPCPQCPFYVWGSLHLVGLGRGQHSPPATATAKSLQSCLTLCDPIDGSPPGSPVPEILQARTLGVGCHCLLQCVKMKSESEVAQSCPTLGDPMDCNLPGTSIHGIFQARALEWGAIPQSRCLYSTSYRQLNIYLLQQNLILTIKH